MPTAAPTRRHASGHPRRNVGTRRPPARHPRRSTAASPRRAIRCTSEVSVARYYDPQTAQFLTRDPLEDETGAPYNYAAGDPLDLTDPMGLDVCVFGHCVDTPSMPSLEDVGNWAAGFGDTVTFGGTEQIRRLINYEANGDMDDMVDHCTVFYQWGGYGGDIAQFFDVPAGISAVLERKGLLKGQEIVFNKDFRVAPLGGSKPRSPAQFFPHYHRRIVDSSGDTISGGGTRWHRPWQKGF